MVTTTTNAAHGDTLLNALRDFSAAANRLRRAFDASNDEQHPVISGLYPFSKQFFEVSDEIAMWLEDAESRAKESTGEWVSEGQRCPAIRWQKPLRPVGDDSNPLNKLLGHITIGVVDFHVEAVEVAYNAKGKQVSKQDSENNYFEEFMAIVGSAAQTVQIGGREYLIGITPYQR